MTVGGRPHCWLFWTPRGQPRGPLLDCMSVWLWIHFNFLYGEGGGRGPVLKISHIKLDNRTIHNIHIMFGGNFDLFPSKPEDLCENTFRIISAMREPHWIIRKSETKKFTVLIWRIHHSYDKTLNVGNLPLYLSLYSKYAFRFLVTLERQLFFYDINSTWYFISLQKNIPVKLEKWVTKFVYFPI